LEIHGFAVGIGANTKIKPTGPGVSNAVKSDQSCERSVLLVNVPSTEVTSRVSIRFLIAPEIKMSLIKKTRNQISNEGFQVIDLDFRAVEISISGSCRYYQDLGYMQLSMASNRLLDQTFVQTCAIS
jgi:hypothetical protein